MQPTCPMQNEISAVTTKYRCAGSSKPHGQCQKVVADTIQLSPKAPKIPGVDSLDHPTRPHSFGAFNVALTTRPSY